MNAIRSSHAFMLTGALLLTACAGGGETGTGLDGGGTTGNDVSVGTITAFGSVWVNGVEFDTNSTQVTLEGDASTQNALRIGMVVTVKGKINADAVSGTADQILVEEVIKGPVDDVAADTLTVLGQTVLVNELTRFEDNVPGQALGGLAVGDLVEVSGIVKGAGSIIATRIDLKSSLTEYKLKGVVANADAATKTFRIGSLLINYAAVSELPAGVPADGALVEVKGTVETGTGIFVASSLQAESLQVEDADRFEIEGFVTSSTLASGGNEFSVNNVPVVVAATTEFDGGLAAELVQGVYVEVEGALQNGIVQAAKVEFKDGVKLESQVASIDSTAHTLTLAGLSGLTVVTNSHTEFEGVANLGAIQTNDRVSVRGRYADASKSVIATRIEVETDSDSKVVLQGPVDALNNPNLTIMGMTVTTHDGMSFEADGANDRASFFAAIKVGDIVEVEGTLAGGVVTWESVGLED